MKLFPYIFVLLLSVSCGELTGESTGANILDKTSDLIGGLSSVSAGENKYLLSGTAKNGGNAGHYFRLKFELPESEKISFYFFSSRSLNTGVKYSFKREAGSVLLTMSLNGLEDTVELQSFSDSLEVDVAIDIHNDHTDAHMLVWDFNGPRGDREDCSFDGGCLYNTEDFAFDVWLGVGKASGTFWGFEGDRSLIKLLEGPLDAISDV
ncbi:putative membrane protein [Halobacteriovorax marinus SJ]|uniref:Membrane protein n=2 Tax=Halobacteriovorax marinus TaxID=97084 RepID=E1WX21_HALMS|nr:putative membrane protein [Halobacteriovorax marinus SJ]